MGVCPLTQPILYPWLEDYPQGVRPNLDYPQEPLYAILERAAARYPQKVATIFLGRKMTYEKLAQAVERFAAGLVSRGLQKGDRVAIMLPNCPQAVISYFGVLRAGGVVVPINPVNVERELVQQLKDVNCHTLVYLDTRHRLIEQIREEADIEFAVVTGLQETMPLFVQMKYRYHQYRKGVSLHFPVGPSTVRFRDFLAQAPSKPPAIEINPREDLAVLQYTGGTTGTPKAAMLTHYNLIANALQIKEWFVGCREGQEVFLGVLPLFHVYGMSCAMNCAIALASTLVLQPRFNTEDVLSSIERYRVTVFPGAPAMYVAINAHPKTPYRNLSSLQAGISGAAALAPDVARVFEEITGSTLVEGYGLTEASPVTHCNPINGIRKPGSVGIGLPDTEYKIVDLENGEKEMPLGMAGELIIRGPQVMKGYWKRPGETAETLRDGWLYTGDIARLDKQGYTYIVDRKKDMIISGGYNVYPQDVESVILELPQVEDVAVVGIPDRFRGETIKAYVVLIENTTLTKEEIVEHCKTRLAAYKVPKLLEFRRELPKTMVGKTLRRMLIEEEKSRPSGF
jgi:long-chain acyl-CoA synthetase